MHLILQTVCERHFGLKAPLLLTTVIAAEYRTGRSHTHTILQKFANGINRALTRLWQKCSKDASPVSDSSDALSSRGMNPLPTLQPSSGTVGDSPKNLKIN